MQKPHLSKKTPGEHAVNLDLPALEVDTVCFSSVDIVFVFFYSSCSALHPAPLCAPAEAHFHSLTPQLRMHSKPDEKQVNSEPLRQLLSTH